MTSSYRILLVEDDASLGYVLKEYLTMSNYQVTWAKDGVEALATAKSQSFDLLLVDVMLPRKDGFTLVSELKEIAPAQPVIFLTAKSLKVDKLKGFKLGADDYITKPVEEEELLARISAVIKRSAGPGAIQDTIRIGKYEFNVANLTLTGPDGEKTLSNREAEVLQKLSRTPEKLVERKKILTDLWGANDYFTRRSMDVIVSRLRKYLRADPGVSIVNVHGKGFILKIAIS